MTLLYLISPPQIDPLPFAISLEEALRAGEGKIGAFQLRLKEAASEEGEKRLTLPAASREHILRAVERLLPVCHNYEVPFILNDDPELARACGADGVHLGQEDGSVAHARELLGEEAVIGVTCHNSMHLAMEAAEQGADYVAFGAFYETSSKTDAAKNHWGVPAPDILREWTTLTTVPCVAIGGITPANCRPLIEAGADFLAAITAIWNHPHGAAEGVREFVTNVNKY